MVLNQVAWATCAGSGLCGLEVQSYKGFTLWDFRVYMLGFSCSSPVGGMLFGVSGLLLLLYVRLLVCGKYGLD